MRSSSPSFDCIHFHYSYSFKRSYPPIIMTILSLSSGDDDNSKYDTSPIKRKQRWIHGLKVDRIRSNPQ